MRERSRCSSVESSVRSVILRMISWKNTSMFTPSTYRPRFVGGHKQTLYAWSRSRQFPNLPPPEERLFDVASDARVLAHCHVHRESCAETATPRRTVIL